MATITYTPDNLVDRIATVYGVTFQDGRSVNSAATRLTPGQLQKLRGNPQFTVEDDDGTVHHAVPEVDDEAPVIDPRDLVEIPDDWADLHWKTKAKLAKALGSDAEDAAQADEAIEAELLRRNGIVADEE